MLLVIAVILVSCQLLMSGFYRMTNAQKLHQAHQRHLLNIDAAKTSADDRLPSTGSNDRHGSITLQNCEAGCYPDSRADA